MKYFIWEDSVAAYDFNLLSVFTFQDFEESCHLLRKCGAVQISDQEVKETEEGQTTTAFLRALLQPFIDAYQVCEPDSRNN